MNSTPSPPPNYGYLQPPGTFGNLQSKSACFQERKLKMKIPLRWDFKIALAPDGQGIYTTPQAGQSGGPSISVTPESRFKVVLIPDTQVIAAWAPGTAPFNSDANLDPPSSQHKCDWPSEDDLLINNFEWVQAVRDYGQDWFSIEAKKRVQKWLDEWFIVKWARFPRTNTELLLYGDLVALDKYGHVLGGWGNYDNQEAAVSMDFCPSFKLRLLCHTFCDGSHGQEGEIGYFYVPKPDSEEAVNWSIDENGYWSYQ